MADLREVPELLELIAGHANRLIASSADALAARGVR
jgi:hypothetical protein